MGKHSDFVFSNNTNTEAGLEDHLLEENECLTSQIIKDSGILNVAVVESKTTKTLKHIGYSDHGKTNILIPEDNIDLLNNLELQVNTYKLTMIILIICLIILSVYKFVFFR